MTHVFSVVALSVLLAVAAAVWKSWTPRPDHGASTVSIGDVMQKANAQSLPTQEIEDRAMAFISAETQ